MNGRKSSGREKAGASQFQHDRELSQLHGKAIEGSISEEGRRSEERRKEEIRECALCFGKKRTNVAALPTLRCNVT